MSAKPKLKKDTWPDGYVASGPIDGLTPGRRLVRRLELRRLGAPGRGGLAALAAFPDLVELVIDGAADVDLADLRGRALERVVLRNVEGADLAAVSALPSLRALDLFEVRAGGSFPTLLPEGLRRLAVVGSSAAAGSTLRRLTESIEWAAASNLRDLHLVADPDAPVRIDWSLLRWLPDLERLEARHGVWHDESRGASPLEPPFDGLPRSLEWLRIDAWDPEPLRAQLAAYLGRTGEEGPVVFQRYPPEPRRAPWEPFEDGAGWQIAGSLSAWADSAETEYDACEAALQQLREADRDLAARIVLDPESDATGIYAETRKDLERTIAILGLS